MKRIVLMVTLLLALLLVIGGPVFAQDTFAFCGDLSDADCALLKESQTASMALQSASTQFDMALSISNIPDAPFEALDFSINGSGAFAIDPALMDSMMSLQSDPSALFSTPDALNEWLVSLIKGVSGDLSLTVNLPAELTETLSSEERTVPSTLTVGLRLVDGFGYINLDDIAAAMPDTDIPPGWIGADLASFIEQAMEQSGAGGMSSMDPEIMQSYMNSFQDPAFLGEFMTVERLEDTDVAGQTAAVFHYTFDYGAFFQSEAFQNMMQAQMKAMSEISGEDISESDQAEMEQAMSMMGPMFEDLNLEFRQVVGLDDKYIHLTEIHMDWDMSGFMAMVEPDSQGVAPSFIFDITATSSDFNAVPEIAAPEGATIFPLNMPTPSNNM